MINSLTTCVYLLISASVSVSQLITTDPPLDPDDFLCPGEVLILTCETKGSSTLSWASDEYIGADGSQLEFASFNAVGDSSTSPVNPNTVATLINKTSENVLVSQLRIIALAQFLDSSVTCISSGTRNTTRVQVLGDPGMPLDVRSYQKEDTNGKCDVFLLWNPPSNIAMTDVSHYMVYIDDRNIANETTQMSPAPIFVIYRTCDCDISTISISAVNKCDRAGQKIPNIETNDINFLINEPGRECSLTTVTTSETYPQCSEGSAMLVAVVVLSIVIIILLGVIVSLLLFWFRKKIFNIHRRYNIAPNELNSNNGVNKGKPHQLPDSDSSPDQSVPDELSTPLICAKHSIKH